MSTEHGSHRRQRVSPLPQAAPPVSVNSPLESHGGSFSFRNRLSPGMSADDSPHGSQHDEFVSHQYNDDRHLQPYSAENNTFSSDSQMHPVMRQQPGPRAGSMRSGAYSSNGEYVNNMPGSPYSAQNGARSPAAPPPPPNDPFSWMSMSDVKEPDDDLHDPSKRSRKPNGVPQRALLNVGTLILLTLALLMLFAGYPILHYFRDTKSEQARTEALTKGRQVRPPVNQPGGQFPMQWGKDRPFIDPDTPKDAYTTKSTYTPSNGKTMNLVFSDEFNVDGRSFYPGDDPFWEAVDLHYWQTGNYEWYDPEAVTTRGGSLVISLEQMRDHNQNFRGGMLQSWNKFCFTGGTLVASIQLPGKRTVGGLWPAFWIMGNLGRAGYGATLQGTWPYSYDTCDVGTLMNQTTWDGQPVAAAQGGDTVFNQKHGTKSLSFLPGQKLSACTCKGEDHPGPWLKDQNRFKGRSAPEIDVFEAQYNTKVGSGPKGTGVSQSCQMAPYNWGYDVTQLAHNENTTACYHFKTPDGTINSYMGEITQQSISGESAASQTAVQVNAIENELTNKSADFWATYSLEYSGGSNGYVAWTSADKPSWEIYPEALRPDPTSGIGARTFPEEPMYILFNLGLSSNFVSTMNWEELLQAWDETTDGKFEMLVDWVRVYQDPTDKSQSIGCSPDTMPTEDYINKHMDAYTNPNYTLWGNTKPEGGYGGIWPRNRLYTDGCKSNPTNQPGDPVHGFKRAPAYTKNQIGQGNINKPNN